MKHDIFISYRRDGGEHLAGRVNDALKVRGFRVFMDVEDLKSGPFDDALFGKIEQATDFIVIMTPGCMDRCANEGDWLRQEIKHAITCGGNIVPVLTNRFHMPAASDLPADISAIVRYNGPTIAPEMFDASIDKLVSKFLKSTPAGSEAANPGKPQPKVSPTESGLAPLEPVGGAVPLDSRFYIERPTDAEFHAAMARCDSIVLVKGARQIGKTSLMARGLQQAREAGSRVVLTDFQKLSTANLESADALFFALANLIADQLDVDVSPSKVWSEDRSPSSNFERFLRREILTKIPDAVVWGLDEVDRLFTCSFGSDVFALFRSWHNERALNPSGPWRRLTLAITYATEAHLFITDLNQSPFNVGTRLTLSDFTMEQVAELNSRYGSPLHNSAELARYYDLVSGHPDLVRRGLHEMTTHKLDIKAFETQAEHDEGLFGDHLRRILVLLAKDPDLTEVVRGILRGQGCPNDESFYRLRSAGVMAGDTRAEIKPRCRLYGIYLTRHLL